MIEAREARWLLADLEAGQTFMGSAAFTGPTPAKKP